MAKFRICKEFDIPYVGGYSKDGQTIYISRKLPISFKTSLDIDVKVLEYLVIHEITEKALMQALRYRFNAAHSIALGSEIAALRRDKVPVDEYYGFINKWVNHCMNPLNITYLPEDLDLTPYREDRCRAVLRRIRQLKKEQKV